MKHDGYSSDTIVSTTRRQRKTKEICRSFTCISPWFVLSRWLKGGTSRESRCGFMERKWKKDKMGGHFDIKGNSGVVKGSINHDASSSSREVVLGNFSAEIDKDDSLNLGLGLISLVATSRNELNKMVELHNKIELLLLLHNIQTESQNQDNKQLCMPSNSTISSSYSNNVVQETLYNEEHDSGRYISSLDLGKLEIGISSCRYMRREKSRRMDRLEAELEYEFDRMQLKMDEINVEGSAPEESHNEEVAIEHHEYISNGVPPRELETKLHELLESRQQERLDELEIALEYAMEQLEAKQKELSWWKDTARLVSHNLPNIPSLLEQAKKRPVRKLDFDRTVDGQSSVN